MRVIAGIAKGRKLHAPDGIATRPTGDRVKESLFNILSERVSGSSVLDLYAGTGALAIEALSRGATTATLVESERSAIDSIGRNLDKTGFADKANIERTPVRQALEKLERAGQRFDLILLDPPYRIESAELQGVLEQAQQCLDGAGVLILEHRAGAEPPDPVGRLSKVDMRVYGDIAVSFYKKQED